MATKYQYRPLNVSQNEVRVVRLAASRSRRAKVCCSLIHMSLDNNIRFEALSYTWGDVNPKYSIYLDERKFSVTKNLEIALRHLRYAQDERYLWIDALSINQDDIPERNQQVPKMGQIYHTAAKVVIWLGLASENSDVAIDLSLEACTKRLELQAWMFEAIRRQGRAEHWKAAVNLFERDYWRRVWIIQEIFFARHLILRCGFRSIRWSDFILPYFSLRLAFQVANSEKNHVEIIGNNPGLINTLANLQNRAILPVYIEQCKRNAENPKVGHHVPLVQLLMFTRNSLCSDPRDKIYGIAGMAIQYKDHRALKVNYRLPTRDVYIETTRILIESNKGCRPGPVGVICASKPHLSNGSLPSWVPDWSSPLGRNSYTGIGTESTIFNANGSSPPEPSFSIESDVLRVRGIIIATTDHLGAKPLHELEIALMSPSDLTRYSLGPSSPDSVFFTARRLATSTSRDMPHSTRSIETRREEFTRTLMLNHDMPSLVDGLEVRPDNVVFRTLSEDTVQKFCQEVISRIDPGELLGNYFTQSAPNRELLNTVLNNLRKYRFCISSDGSFVMGPPSILQGDLICILFGCDMPVILREIDENRYVFVGECYMHGIMDGEAIERMRAGKYGVEEFHIY